MNRCSGNPARTQEELKKTISVHDTWGDNHTVIGMQENVAYEQPSTTWGHPIPPGERNAAYRYSDYCSSSEEELFFSDVNEGIESEDDWKSDRAVSSFRSNKDPHGYMLHFPNTQQTGTELSRRDSHDMSAGNRDSGLGESGREIRRATPDSIRIKPSRHHHGTFQIIGEAQQDASALSNEWERRQQTHGERTKKRRRHRHRRRPERVAIVAPTIAPNEDEDKKVERKDRKPHCTETSKKVSFGATGTDETVSVLPSAAAVSGTDIVRVKPPNSGKGWRTTKGNEICFELPVCGCEESQEEVKQATSDGDKDPGTKPRTRCFMPMIPAQKEAEVEAGLTSKYKWFIPDLSREESEKVLTDDGREGVFVVRESASSPGNYCLSVLATDGSPTVRLETLHYYIRRMSEGQYFLSHDHPKDSIPNLIKYHHSNPGGLAARLKYRPNSRQIMFLQTAGREVPEIEPSHLQLGQEVGRGQFGVVLLGVYKGRLEVAVKVMREGAMSEDAFVEEARTMFHLTNKHLVQLFGVVTKHRPISIVTEFMKYGALLDYLHRNKKSIVSPQVPYAHLLDIALQVSRGMRYLEQKLVIHRDLAARNCLIGHNFTVKVADFGLSRFVLDDQYHSSLGSRFPVKWAPPEVLSHQIFSTKSDIWAFGILVWEIFTGGDVPYGQMSTQEVSDLILKKNGRLMMPQACPPAIRDVTTQCWRTDPQLRPTFAQLEVRLGELVDMYTAANV